MNRGFSLVELSIVLVILGLLTGGILAGQSLIRASELRAVSTEYSRYVTAVQSFRDKYFALPGDMSNATKFWGEQDAVPATCITTSSSSALTCNGNGDGLVANWATEASATEYEMWRAWQHLANAGLVEGSYTGVNGGGNYRSTLGTNNPRSKLGNAGWTFVYLGSYAGDSAYFAGNYGNYFSFGAQHATRFTFNPALKAEEAWNIDTKMDDGSPHIGKVVALKTAFNADCVSAGNVAYALTATSIACGLNFIPGL